mgnify:CR=1 FL=1
MIKRLLNADADPFWVFAVLQGLVAVLSFWNVFSTEEFPPSVRSAIAGLEVVTIVLLWVWFPVRWTRYFMCLCYAAVAMLHILVVLH